MIQSNCFEMIVKRCWLFFMDRLNGAEMGPRFYINRQRHPLPFVSDVRSNETAKVAPLPLCFFWGKTAQVLTCRVRKQGPP